MSFPVIAQIADFLCMYFGLFMNSTDWFAMIPRRLKDVYGTKYDIITMTKQPCLTPIGLEGLQNMALNHLVVMQLNVSLMFLE